MHKTYKLELKLTLRRISSVISKPLLTLFYGNNSGLGIMFANLTINSKLNDICSISPFHFFRKVQKMSNLKISFSTFLVQRLILWLIYRYPMFCFQMLTLSNKPDSSVHYILRIQAGLQAFVSTFTEHWRGEYNLSWIVSLDFIILMSWTK